jgi:hypothetical protein
MLKLITPILIVLLMGALSTTGRTDGEGTLLPADPDGATQADGPAAPTATAILATYRGSDQPYVGLSDTGASWHRAAIEARGQAEADLDHARDQLAQARAEVARLIAEIRIEGAESVDIGGEVRAARLVEAEWQRAADAVLAHIGKIDAAIVMRGEAPQEHVVRQSQR